MTKQTRRRFTPEYKEQAVARLSEEGVSYMPALRGNLSRRCDQRQPVPEPVHLTGPACWPCPPASRLALKVSCAFRAFQHIGFIGFHNARELACFQVFCGKSPFKK